VSALFTLAFHLKFAGVALLILAFAHVFFEKRFHWQEELVSLSPFNRQMFYVHNFFITLVIGYIGALSFCGTNLLIEKSPLASYISGAIAFFWLCRWCVQFFFYDVSLWRGKKFETLAHILFGLIWTYLVFTYGWAFSRQIFRFNRELFLYQPAIYSYYSEPITAAPIPRISPNATQFAIRAVLHNVGPTNNVNRAEV
jgi:hypothetical protein